MLPFAIVFAATDMIVAGTLYWFYRNAEILCEALDHTNNQASNSHRAHEAVVVPFRKAG
jgi:hypothetical protein